MAAPDVNLYMALFNLLTSPPVLDMAFDVHTSYAQALETFEESLIKDSPLEHKDILTYYH